MFDDTYAKLPSAETYIAVCYGEWGGMYLSESCHLRCLIEISHLVTIERGLKKFEDLQLE